MSHAAPQRVPTVEITIDGKPVTVAEKTTLFDAARRQGIQIPVLCHEHDKTPVGVCRMCVVELHQQKEGKDNYKGKPFAAACVRALEKEDQGLVVETKSPAVIAARKTLLELLMADHHAPCIREQHTEDCELEALAREYGAAETRYSHREVSRGHDNSSHIILVDHSACILCDRCIRACAEVRDNNVIARQGKGYNAAITFGMGQPMDSSGCVSCGECMVSCPTGALTNKISVDHQFDVSLCCDLEELKQLPMFAHVSGTFLSFNREALVKRTLKRGEYFFREGDPNAATAFYILDGEVEIFIANRMAQVKTQRAAGAAFKMESTLAGPHEGVSEDQKPRRTHIPVDAPVELSYADPIERLGKGALFGEMSCLNAYPRSATVRAATDCIVIEMRRNVLDMLQKNKDFREEIERQYLDHAFANHLRNSGLFAGLTAAFIDELRKNVALLRYAPNEIIFRQGDVAEGFYLVRRGFVKVSESYTGGELVLAYLPTGSHFGEISLLGDGKHTATCSALDHVDLVRISSADFKTMLRQFPAIRSHLERIRDERLHENQKRFSRVHEMPVNEFVRQGLMQAQSLLVLDLKKCTRCDQCVKACADAHEGVTRLVRDGLRFEHYLIATSCRHCRDPLCMVCPVGAIHRGKSLDVTIDHSCIGCGECAKNCPYGNINMHYFDVAGEDLEKLGLGQEHAKRARVRKATNCNLCRDEAEPACVYACPHDAAHRVDNPAEFFNKTSGH